ncbi:MAG: hypothetical protein COA88_10400 [Kordia sp.]|nr:MAG: hypothetical protein COA88_10400 [Kordia sp.]
MGIQAMITSIKNNNRRQLHTPFDKDSIYLSGNRKKNPPQFKKATQEQLLMIRRRIKISNSIYQQKLIGYTCLTSITIISTFVYLIKIYL